MDIEDILSEADTVVDYFRPLRNRNIFFDGGSTILYEPSDSDIANLNDLDGF